MGMNQEKRQLTEAQKLRLVSGHDFWQSESIADVGIPAIRMSDGPHGLRYQATESDHLGINESVEATAFPTASASANSWDLGLLRRMGEAIGREARSLGVDVVLGPGVNIKRNPLGGRNFEYFSEDPQLAGQLAAAWISGLQSTGTGASLKHFAGNNQETDRLLSDSLIDQTALHELYLEAFRIAVMTAEPKTVMNAYNKVNGTYMSENTYLQTTVLRDQWGFQGAIVTDWGALNNPVESVNAGTDLEMPGNQHFFMGNLKKGLASGALKPAALDRAADKVTAIATTQRPKGISNREKLLSSHADLSQKIEEESAVLMINRDHVLPLDQHQDVLLVGEMARHTRFQGAGSSHINAPEVVSIEKGLRRAGATVDYVAGYSLTGKGDANLVAEAAQAAQKASQVVVVVGLPNEAESEGFDRQHMRLPDNQNEVVSALTAVNQNVVVLLVAGAPVELPWRSEVAGLMALYLGGERVGAAAANLLLGEISPSGHLAESYPVSYADVPSSALYGQNPRSVPYAESLYVGYRYYDKANLAVAFPFGYGLSYTTFNYGEPQLNRHVLGADEAGLTLTLTVENTGNVAGATVLQLYVSATDQDQLIPEKALQGFRKVWLDPGERQTVKLPIEKHAFERWQDDRQAWQVAPGGYQIFLGTSSRNKIATFDVQVAGSPLEKVSIPAWYRQPNGQPTVGDFESLSGLKPAPLPELQAGQLTQMNTPRELSRFSTIVKKVTEMILSQMQSQAGNQPGSPEAAFLETIVLDTPLIRLAQQSSGSLKKWQVTSLVWLANHSLQRH
ncbi:glycoside hydrolase family 3 C-terminal domain-containing protein [uncultured Secundilactobacillus sp.]|uniref:glycoside hydrolase family 3 C-terminal domain-containing protein n=1 Tax=uncultured Secundilactobacillus sp. TaxID=2813935 RepID=UPI00258F0314|nr:glycoside hydrolase family 3 C-terminal domain-containing protein [uncultured Secundilactobacillus sp.]